MSILLTVLGYLLTGLGGWLLFKNAPRDHGGNEVLMIPITNEGPSNSAMARERAGMLRRHSGNDAGGLFILFGTILQLAGYLWPLAK